MSESCDTVDNSQREIQNVVEYAKMLMEENKYGKVDYEKLKQRALDDKKLIRAAPDSHTRAAIVTKFFEDYTTLREAIIQNKQKYLAKGAKGQGK
ncbi:hypothetical protein M3Y99_01930000 [Aphelenchoides fujianensis]|nr:hypothetical protein M3Y99_01930000 [Aphelenchoides fujianensis]